MDDWSCLTGFRILLKQQRKVKITVPKAKNQSEISCFVRVSIAHQWAIDNKKLTAIKITPSFFTFITYRCFFVLKNVQVGQGCSGLLRPTH